MRTFLAAVASLILLTSSARASVGSYWELPGGYRWGVTPDGNLWSGWEHSDGYFWGSDMRGNTWSGWNMPGGYSWYSGNPPVIPGDDDDE
ncbi:hypothetical protein [Methylacidimicrobium tartarophylax]|nr:hypothetical protein [Methylacidimicrobium tartarophylax]